MNEELTMKLIEKIEELDRTISNVDSKLYHLKTTLDGILKELEEARKEKLRTLR